MERISKCTMIGFNNQLHPLYSIPKAIPPLSTDCSFTENDICSSEFLLEQLLLSHLAVTPPRGCYYPLAPVGGYKLVPDSHYSGNVGIWLWNTKIQCLWIKMFGWVLEWGSEAQILGQHRELGQRKMETTWAASSSDHAVCSAALG